MKVYIIFSYDGASKQLVSIFSSKAKANEYLRYYRKRYTHLIFNCVEFSVIE